uniref:Corticotropin-releasing factor-binding protein n=1 Tax=Oryctolagus cuniculus TaxID=9986 RepID=A0A5F9CWU7_RABIT
MSPACRLGCHLLLLCLCALRGRSQELELREAEDYDPFLLFGASPKRDADGEELYRRTLRCVDALSLQGQFTFTADRPQLHCAVFLIAEPGELLTVRVDRASLDCPGGDLLKVFDGWILKGEKFPSSQDHPLPTPARYMDFCTGGLSGQSVTSSQNVAMILFRVHDPGNGFTVTVRTDPNLFPCNVVSPTPSGRFTLVVPRQRRNCSFSVVYPVVIRISDLALGRVGGLHVQLPSAGCGGTGDFVELLGGTGLDPSKMTPLADLCYPFRGPGERLGTLAYAPEAEHLQPLVHGTLCTWDQHTDFTLQPVHSVRAFRFCFPGVPASLPQRLIGLSGN